MPFFPLFNGFHSLSDIKKYARACHPCYTYVLVPFAISMADDAEGRRNLAIWLEDTKIRHYKIEDRTGLRSTDPTAWEAAFVKVRQAIAIADTFLKNILII